MRFRSMIRYSIAAVLLASSFAGYASESVPCPSVELVKSEWKHLDSIEIMKNSQYMVKSDYDSIFDENSKLWWEVATVVTAPDLNTAFYNGQENVKNVYMQVDKYAKESGIYFCEYKESASSQSVYMFAEIPDNGGKMKRLISKINP